MPLLKSWSSLSSISRGLVYINTLGHTYLHELFIEYEQVTAWVARFSYGKQIVINCSLCWMVQWIYAQVAATNVGLSSNNQLEETIG